MAEQRNWAELPSDVLSAIYRKLGTFEVILSAQAVCRLWRQLSLEPHVWRFIELRCPTPFFTCTHLQRCGMEAIARSGGIVEQFHIIYHISNERDVYCGHVIYDLLLSLANRTTGLRSLVLIYPDYIYELKKQVDLVSRFPLLKELHISNCLFVEERYLALLRSCSNLKISVLSNSSQRSAYHGYPTGIADNLSRLGEQLVGNHMGNTGLRAILYNCRNLEFPGICECRRIHIADELQAELDQIKDGRLFEGILIISILNV